VNPERIGVVVGSGIGGIRSIENQMDNLRRGGPSRVSPLLVPSGTPDVAANEIALFHGFTGPSWAVSTACSSGSDAIIHAARCLRDGAADVMITGGAEAPIGELAISSFANLGALARGNGDPQKVCRPFDRQRSGFVLGEGAGILVLETGEHARGRGAEILAVLAGFGQTTDAYHKTAPDPTGRGAARAIRMALESGGLSPEEVGYINAHGTSTLQNDPAETLAIKSALGEYARRVPVSSTKSMTGHLIGAAGAIEAIIAVETILTGWIPPTINYETPDPDCDLFYVPNTAREARVEAVLSNSFAFGGHNSALAIVAAGHQEATGPSRP
jgi:3-oxoacyl-[acyl-carrier-protein] synthase II